MELKEILVGIKNLRDELSQHTSAGEPPGLSAAVARLDDAGDELEEVLAHLGEVDEDGNRESAA